MCRGKPIKGSGYRKDPADANGKALLDAIIAKRHAEQESYIVPILRTSDQGSNSGISFESTNR